MANEIRAVVDPNEQPFRLLVDAVRDYAIYMLNPQGYVSTWNSGAERIKGYTTSEIIGQHFSRFFQAEDIAGGLPQHILATATAIGHFEGEGWRLRKDGSRFWASVVVYAVRNNSGEIVSFAKVTRDLTERKRSEEALQAEKDKLQVTLYSIADGVICTDVSGNITLMNPVAEVLTGWTLEQAQGRTLEEVFHLIYVDSEQMANNPVRDCLAHQQAYYLQENVALLAKNGTQRDIQDSAAPIRMPDGQIIGAVLVFQDVTNLRTAQREIAYNATHDSLTALPNRKQFEANLEDALYRAKVTGKEQTVCFLDLDRFKVVNDTAGHAAGDVLLQTVSGLILHCVRGSDIVARLGGDEFAIILTSCTVAQAQSTLTKIRESIAAFNFLWEGRLFKISVSIGVVAVTAASTATEVMKQADVACYVAKNAGRNRISVYEPLQGEGHERHRQLQMAADIQDAIAQNRFSLLVQKIMAIDESDVPRYEVLLRMHDLAGSVLLPEQFIPAAERYDLMGHIDRWVFRRVLEFYGPRLQRVQRLQLNVNISANSLNDPLFLPFLLDLIERSELSPHSLTIEITETALINNLIAAGTVIGKLRSIGCKIALDDFGIGLSSFNYLRHLEVDFIKIEGSFVRNISTSSVDHAIVRAINNVAHEIHSQTIAEYVENDRILEMVTALEVDFAQGRALGELESIETILGT